jgi:CRISPR-associated protein Csx10
MNSSKSFSVIRYTIELQSPLLATDVMGDPNSAVSMPFIPGSLLRGALIARYLQSGQPNFDPGEDAEAHRLFFSDSTRFLNAYPMNPHLGKAEKRRALPMPMAWRFDKDDYVSDDDSKKEIHDLSRKTVAFRDEAVEGAFFWRDKKETVDRFSPPRKINVHTQRDARRGRSTRDSGAVYRYDGLAAGMRLQAVILTSTEHKETIEKLLAGATLWIGRARRAGYGRSLITEIETPDFWRESGTDDSPPPLNANDTLHITFTSDALLRDQNGQATLDPRGDLETALGLPVDSLTLLPDRSWAGSKIISGFNRKWRLPLPQTVALAAGSIFVYQTKTPIDWQKLGDLERNGIGERRNEGFGRALANWLDGENEEFSSYETRLSPKFELAPLTAEEAAQAKVITERLLRRRLDEKLRGEINHTRLKGSLKKNQLARLRVILRSIQVRQAGQDVQTEQPERISGEPGIQRLKEYFKSIQERRSTRDQFARTQVDENGKRSPKLLDWMKEQLAILDDDPDEEEKEREERQRKLTEKMIANWNDAVTLGKGTVVVSAAVDEKIAREYALRLIDQVLYRAAKAQVAEEDKNG